VALQQVDPGVRTDRLLTFQMSFQGPSYSPPRRPAALERALQAFRALPNIEGAAAISQLPVTGRGIGAWLNIVGRPAPQGRNPDSAVYRVVTPDYFRVAGLKLVRGRWFQETDTRDQTRAVIIDEALTRRHWPDEDPLGRQIILGAIPDNVLFPDARIVGVVSNVRQIGLGADPPGMVYLPHRLVPMWAGFSIMLRTAGDPRTVIADVRSTLRAFDPSIALANVRTMDDILAQSVAPTRLPLMLVGIFASLALGLASLGVFSVLSYSVNRRRQELGIRLTLGAEPASLRLLVLRDGMIPALAGIAVGAAGAVALGGLVEGMLFNVRAADPATFAGVGLVLLACAAAACYLPARRATQVDPLVVLRTE
jgi:putative ABC transport system permease protein